MANLHTYLQTDITALREHQMENILWNITVPVLVALQLLFNAGTLKKTISKPLLQPDWPVCAPKEGVRSSIWNEIKYEQSRGWRIFELAKLNFLFRLRQSHKLDAAMWTVPLLWSFSFILTQETGTDCDSTSINTNLIERSCGGDKSWVESHLKEFGQSLSGCTRLVSEYC